MRSAIFVDAGYLYAQGSKTLSSEGLSGSMFSLTCSKQYRSYDRRLPPSRRMPLSYAFIGTMDYYVENFPQTKIA